VNVATHPGPFGDLVEPYTSRLIGEELQVNGLRIPASLTHPYASRMRCDAYASPHPPLYIGGMRDAIRRGRRRRTRIHAKKQEIRTRA
jgi:hypothetical protein